MKVIMRRIFILVLCIAIVMGDSAIVGFAAEIVEQRDTNEGNEGTEETELSEDVLEVPKVTETDSDEAIQEKIDENVEFIERDEIISDEKLTEGNDEKIYSSTDYAFITVSEEDIAHGICSASGNHSVDHIEWQVTKDGELVIKGFGNWEKADDSFYGGESISPWTGYYRNIISATVSLDKATDIHKMFCGLKKLTAVDFEKIDTTACTNFSGIFDCCYQLEEVDLSKFNSENVTIMDGMFLSCNKLKSIDLSNLDTSHVTTMWKMFGDCKSLTSIDMSFCNFSSVENIDYMFVSCESMKTLNLEGCDFNNVSYATNVFENCKSLIEINTPIQLKLKINIPNSLYYENEVEYTMLPQNLDNSIRLITKRYPLRIEEKKVYIDSSEDLVGLSYNVSGGESYKGYTIELENDIDLSTSSFVPIGNEQNQFMGSFWGKNHTISGLTLDIADNAAVFGTIGAENEIVIKDVNISGVNLKSANNAAGLVSSVRVQDEGVLCIENCNVDGTVSSKGVVAGIIGTIQGDGDGKVYIYKCNNNATLQAINVWDASSRNLGGIVGTINCNNNDILEIKIVQCINTGTISSSNSYGYNSCSMGGIIACHAGGYLLIEQCANYGTLEAIAYYERVGGIIGYLCNSINSRVIISNSFVNASITGTCCNGSSQAGGVVGGTSSSSVNKSEIRYCYATGELKSGNKAGISCWHSDGLETLITNTYFNKDKFGLGTDKLMNQLGIFSTVWLNKKVYNSYGMADEKLKNKDSFNGWDFENIWDISEEINGGYPYLRFTQSYDMDSIDAADIVPKFWQGSGNDTKESILEVDFNQWDIDKWFSENRVKYNHGLTKASLAVAMAAFDKDYSDIKQKEEKGFDGDPETGRRTDHIKTMFRYMGMDEETIYDNYPIPNEDDTIGVAIASKNVSNDTSLIVVAIRGSGYESEWGNNFVVGTGEEHAGFNMAANNILIQLNSFIRERDLLPNVKIWICGYSRAAATANLISARLIDKEYDFGNLYYIDELQLEKEDIYGFCFECPRNTQNPKSNDSMYEYIVNIINPVDFVPKVAMNNNLGWKYRRYGTDYCLPSESATKDYSYWFDRVVEPYQKISGNPMTPTGLWLEEFAITQIFSNLAAITENPKKYNESYQELFKKVGSNILGSGKNDLSFWDWINGLCDGISVIKAFKNPTLIFSIVCEGYMYQIIGVDPTSYHYPELCYAWLYEIDESEWDKAIRTDYHTDYVTLDIANVIIDKIKITGPKSVNKSYDSIDSFEIEVWDNSNHLVAKMTNGEVISNEGILLLINDNQKIVIGTPGDGSYTVTVHSNENVKLNCSIKDIDSATNDIKRVTVYSDISINSGENINLIINNDTKKEQSSFEIKDNENEVIVPINDQIGSEIEMFAINAIAKGCGTVQGGGTFAKGEKVILTAKPDETNMVKAWIVDGEVVSEGLEYSFIAEKNADIEVVFEKYQDFWISTIPDQNYIGTAVKPEVKVWNGENRLTVNRDYSITFSNNVNAGIATVTIVGKGNYKGKIVEHFNIVCADINSCDVENVDVIANGRVQKALPKVSTIRNGKTIALRNNVDYFLTYPDNQEGAYKEAGVFNIVLNGMGNYSGTKTVIETISVNKRLLSKATVRAIPTQKYTGTELKPSVIVLYGKDKLVQNEDYKVDYCNNCQVGNATIVISGLGKYVGTRNISFKIVGTPLNKCLVDYTKAYDYNGKDIEPGKEDDFRVYIKATRNSEEIVLKENEDYTLSYVNNQNAGNATIVINGINGYSGMIRKTFRINPYNISNLTDIILEENIVYKKGGAKPVVCVKNNDIELLQGIDYSLSYINNFSVNDATGTRKPTIKITGRGNYKGVKTVNFAIKKSELDLVTMTATDFTATGRPGFNTLITLYDTDGKKLVAGRDYDKNVEYSKDGVVIDPKTFVLSSGDVVCAEVKSLNDANYSGSKETSFRVVSQNLMKATVKIAAQTYTGKAVSLNHADIKITFGRNQALSSEDYEIIGYKNNTNKGTAQVILKGVGNYGGTKTVNFVITQKSMNYTIIYDKNAEDAIGAMTNSSTPTGTRLSRNLYKRNGYRFTGWNTKPNGSGQMYNNCETFRVKSVFQVFGTKEVLYAQWEPLNR